MKAARVGMERGATRRPKALVLLGFLAEIVLAAGSHLCPCPDVRVGARNSM
jgi:hypothetical protein